MPSSPRAREKPFDPRDTAAYTLAEAARYLKLPPATLRSWVMGRPYPKGKGVAQFRPLIRPRSSPPPLLSFRNLTSDFFTDRDLGVDNGWRTLGGAE